MGIVPMTRTLYGASLILIRKPMRVKMTITKRDPGRGNFLNHFELQYLVKPRMARPKKAEREQEL